MMGSSTALILFSLFIVWGFIVEAQARGKVTYAAWLPLFWMVICASRSVSQWLNLTGSDYPTERDYVEASLSGSPVDRVVLTIAIVMGLIILFKRKQTVIKILRDNKALVAFTLYLGITVLWSDIGEASFRRWTRLFGTLVMALVLVTEPEPLESIRSVVRRCAYLLIPLSVVLVKYFPLMGVLFTRLGERMWVGVAVMKNGLGHLCFVISFFLIWDTIRTWRTKTERSYSKLLFDAVVLAMSLWLIRGPGSASSSGSIGSLIVGMAMLGVLSLPAVKRNFRFMGILTVLAGALFLFLESSFGLIELAVTALGRNMTFTDRVPLWNTLVDIGFQKPLFGYGYGGFWTAERMAYIEEKAGSFSQGHNGYLELFVEGGLVAIILLGVLLISLVYRIQICGSIDYEYAVFRLSLLVMILLANVTESSFARERDLLTFLFCVIALYDGSSKNRSFSIDDRTRHGIGRTQYAAHHLPR